MYQIKTNAQITAAKTKNGAFLLDSFELTAFESSYFVVIF